MTSGKGKVLRVQKAWAHMVDDRGACLRKKQGFTVLNSHGFFLWRWLVLLFGKCYCLFLGLADLVVVVIINLIYRLFIAGTARHRVMMVMMMMNLLRRSLRHRMVFLGFEVIFVGQIMAQFSCWVWWRLFDRIWLCIYQVILLLFDRILTCTAPYGQSSFTSSGASFGAVCHIIKQLRLNILIDSWHLSLPISIYFLAFSDSTS